MSLWTVHEEAVVDAVEVAGVVVDVLSVVEYLLLVTVDVGQLHVLPHDPVG